LPFSVLLFTFINKVKTKLLNDLIILLFTTKTGCFRTPSFFLFIGVGPGLLSNNSDQISLRDAQVDQMQTPVGANLRAKVQVTAINEKVINDLFILFYCFI